MDRGNSRNGALKLSDNNSGTAPFHSQPERCALSCPRHIQTTEAKTGQTPGMLLVWMPFK